MARQVPVDHPIATEALTGAIEVWYMHVRSREMQRLAWPESPQDGLFMRIRVRNAG